MDNGEKSMEDEIIGQPDKIRNWIEAALSFISAIF